ncbi:MAG: hemolysin family protein [Fermentimonas sp.]|jgi:putative hemolysin
MTSSCMIGWWIVFLVMSLFFSGTETAFVASDKLRYAVTKKEKGVYNYMLNSLYRYPRQFLFTLIVAKGIVLVCFVYFTLLIAYHKVLPGDMSIGGVILLILFVSFTILLTDLFIPRALFTKNAGAWVRVFAVPAFFFHLLLYPVAKVFELISRGILYLFGVRSSRVKEQVYGRGELDAYVKKSIDDLSKGGEVDSEVKIFRNALDFTTKKTRDCMVPRPEIVAVSIETDLETLKETFIETGLSRILVYKEDIDDIVGYIHMWEIVNNPSDWVDNVASVSFVPESMQANQLMSDLMQQRRSIAVVVDEFGGTSGIVTMEDLVEEIFGEIEDEYDVDSKFVKKEGANEYVMSGRVEIDYLNEEHGLDLPESDDYSTVAGYLLHHARRFPKAYETIAIGKNIFKILKVTARKIEVVRLITEGHKIDDSPG